MTGAPLTPYDRIESAIIGAGGRMLATAGKLDRRGLGFQATLFALPGGRPVILQRCADGGVEAYVPVIDSLDIDETIVAILTERSSGEVG